MVLRQPTNSDFSDLACCVCDVYCSVRTVIYLHCCCYCFFLFLFFFYCVRRCCHFFSPKDEYFILVLLSQISEIMQCPYTCYQNKQV